MGGCGPDASDERLDDRYRLGPLVASTPVVAVHTAVDEHFGRDVSVRLVRDGASGVDAQEFEAAARAVAALGNPNVRPVWDIGRIGDRPCVVTEPLVKSFADEMRAGPIAAQRLAEVALGCLAALDAVHRIGVAHGPLDGFSVTIDDVSVPKLGDFTRRADIPGTDERAGAGSAARDDLASLARLLLDALKRDARQGDGAATALRRALSPTSADPFTTAEEMADAIRSAVPATAVGRGETAPTSAGAVAETVAMPVGPSDPSTAEPPPTEMATPAALPHETEPRQMNRGEARSRLQSWWARRDGSGRRQLTAALLVAILVLVLFVVALADQDPALPGTRLPVPELESGDLPPEVPR